MTALAATGYASLDYVVGLAGPIAGDHTTLIDSRDPAAWPRVGGCPAYIAAAAARKGQAAHAVCWVGADPPGQVYKDELVSMGVGVDGVSVMPGRPSPAAILAYQPDRSCACLFDPSFAGDEQLSPQQVRILNEASHVCISVGPPHLVGDILRCRDRRSRLYWVLKRDLRAYPDAVRADLCSQADVIFCNESERGLIRLATRDTIVVQTCGAKGIIVQTAERHEAVPVKQLEIVDTTGAGDTLAGGFIAAEMAADLDPVAALMHGMSSARSLLEARMPETAS